MSDSNQKRKEIIKEILELLKRCNNMELLAFILGFVKYLVRNQGE